MLNRLIGNTAFGLSLISLAGLASVSSVASNITKISHGLPKPDPIREATLSEPVFIQAKKDFTLASGETLKLRQGRSEDSGQCYVKNDGDATAHLDASQKIGALSLGAGGGETTYHDWQFSLPYSGVLFHCEFPRGVEKQQVYREASRILAGYFVITSRS